MIGTWLFPLSTQNSKLISQALYLSCAEFDRLSSDLAHFAFPMLSLLNERGKVPYPVRNRPLYDPHSNDSDVQRHDQKVEKASKLAASGICAESS